MSLVSNTQDIGVQVDCSTKAIEVWERLAIRILTAHKSLICLPNAGMHSSSRQSWVPDWSKTNEHRACLAFHGKERFRASGKTKVSVKVSNDLQTLTVDGFIVDTVDVVAPDTFKITPQLSHTPSAIVMKKFATENLREHSSVICSRPGEAADTHSAYKF